MVNPSVPYTRARYYPNPDELKSWTVDWDDKTASGPCPRCRHSMNMTWKSKLIEMGLAPSQDTVTRRVDCSCQKPHSDGQTSKDSCGAFWFATLDRTPGAQPVTPQSDAKVVAAAESLAKVSEDEETRLRDAAEKWVAGVASVLALLGIAGTVTGGKLFENLSSPTRVIVAVLTALAAAAALAAVIASYKAAYGWPRQVEIDDDEKLMQWYDGRAGRLDTAATRLRNAVTLACLATGLLAAAAIAGWVLPTGKPEPTVKIMLRDGSVRCGELLTPAREGDLRLRRSDTGDAVSISITRIQSIEPTKSC